MPTFAYSTARNAPPAGTIDAVDRAGAIRALLDRGVRPVDIRPVSGPASVARAASSRGRVTSSQASMMIRELATALGAGLPLVTALRTMSGAGRSAAQRRAVVHLVEQVEQGRSLADAMASWGSPFSDLIVSMTRAGESAGRLAEVLSQAAALLERDSKVRGAVLSATLYPAILALLSIGAVAVMMVKIVPSIMKPFADSGTQLPLMTRALIGTSNFAVAWWWLILLVGGAITFGITAWRSTPEGRRRFDLLLLRAPILGPLLRDLAVARFTRTLATLVAAGLPLLQSLRITKGTLGNKAMEAVIDTVSDKVTQGRTLAEPLERSGYFPAMLVQVVALGERSGRLEEMLGQAAIAFEARTDGSIKIFTTLLPLVLVLSMAGVIAFIVMAILLAMLDFQEVLLRS
jgi:general secretion pathway protein F